METSVQKWGNSLAVRLPSKMLKKLNLSQGSPVRILQKKNSLIITAAETYDLDTMLSGISSANLHEPFGDYDPARGREEW